MRRPILLALLGAAAASGATAVPALAGDPILPLSEVRPGMLGEARTVVRGTEIVTFPVRIIDVQRVADAPGGTLILGRAEGSLVASTGGIAEGMSGSPVYVTGSDGVARVIGAIAYGTGDEANVVTGITPIEQTISSSSGRRLLARPAGVKAARRARLVDGAAAARALAVREPGVLGLYPLMRWSAAGISPPVVASISARLRGGGTQVDATGGRTLRPPVPLVPGATMSVLLAGGDISLAGIGTVTYVDGPRIFGLGHPAFGTGAGPVRLLLGDGYVFEVIAAPIRGESYKYAEAGRIQGAIVSDRRDGVSGRLGAADGVPAVSRARHLDRGTASTVRAILAPDERALPIASAALQEEPLARVLDGAAPGTATLTMRIVSPALRRPIVVRNTYAAAGFLPRILEGRLEGIVGALTRNGVQVVPIDSVTVDQTVVGDVRAGRITDARIVPARARAGTKVTLLIRMVPWRAAPRIVRVPLRLPAGLRPGRLSLRVVPNSGEGFDPSPPSLDDPVPSIFSTGGAPRASTRRLEARAPAPPTSRAERVAGAVRALAGRRNDAVQVLGPGEQEEDADAGLVIPTPLIPYAGRARANVTIVRR